MFISEVRGTLMAEEGEEETLPGAGGGGADVENRVLRRQKSKHLGDCDPAGVTSLGTSHAMVAI